MKKIWLFAALIQLGMMGCKNDFKVGAPYKDVTAIYCLLSRTDTAHYVKIMKGYYDEQMDNLLIAQNPDSLYYDSLEVKMEEVSNGTAVNTYLLQKVDLNVEGYGKDPGVFAVSPNYGYKLKTGQFLNANNNYRLTVKNLRNGKIMTSTTPIISDVAMSVQAPVSKVGRLIFSDYSKYSTFIFQAPPNAVIYDVVVRLFYSEKDVLKPDSVAHLYKDLVLSKNYFQEGGKVTVLVQNEEFFRVLNSELGVPKSNINRYIDTPEVRIVAGGSVLKTYMDVQLAQGGGITYDQIKPSYTNFQGDDVYGIFSTRIIKRIPNVPFNDATVDSIIHGIYTQNLNIISLTDD